MTHLSEAAQRKIAAHVERDRDRYRRRADTAQRKIAARVERDRERDERRANVIRLAGEGMMQKDIAERVGVVQSTVWAILKGESLADGLDEREAARRAKRAELAALYAAGMTLQAIGERYELTRERVRQIITPDPKYVAHKVAARRGRVRAARRAEVLRLAGEGMMQKDIAERVGLSQSRVWQILSDAGLVFDHTKRREALAAKRAELAALYAAGMTLQAIGDRYGLTRERVRQIITPDPEYVPRNKRVRRTDTPTAIALAALAERRAAKAARRADVLRLAGEGLSVRDIAERVAGCSRGTVQRIIAGRP
jgi:DNA-binding NarL/FixJ family response regulator